MTEPDPVATLAQQVEDLRASVARYQAIVTAWMPGLSGRASAAR